MTIINMKKLQLIIPDHIKSQILQDFTRLDCIEIKSPDAIAEWDKLEFMKDVAMDAHANRQRQTIKAALDTMDKYFTEKKPFFALRPQLTQDELYEKDMLADADKIAEKTNQLRDQLSALNVEQSQIEMRKFSIEPWLPSPISLDAPNSIYTSLIRGVCPASSDIQALIDSIKQQIPLAEVEQVNSDEEQHYLILICHCSVEAELFESLRPFGFSRVTFQDMRGTASACVNICDRELMENQERQEDLKNQLRELHCKRDLLERAFDAMDLEAQREMLSNSMRRTKETIYVEAWVPENQIIKVERIIKQNKCAYAFSDPLEEEEPPVLIENNRIVKPFSAITDMYGMPASGSLIDPNALVALFFVVFFGMMLGDAMYGLILFLACGLVLRKKKPQGTFKNFMTVACWVGLSSVIFGILFSSWFGDFPTVLGSMLGKGWEVPPVLLAPLEQPMVLLMVALAIGVINLFAGMWLSAWRMIKRGDLIGAVFDIFLWYFIMGGLLYALIGLSMGLPGANIGIYAAVFGAVGVLFTAGRKNKGVLSKLVGGLGSLYGITNYLSDILSYSRLMALGLATGVVAQVMNSMGTLAGNGVGGWILFIIVFLVGQTFNLFIGLLGAFVHSCRLIYVEFFGKFFEGGGRKFSPLRNNTKYVQVEKEE